MEPSELHWDELDGEFWHVISPTGSIEALLFDNDDGSWTLRIFDSALRSMVAFSGKFDNIEDAEAKILELYPLNAHTQWRLSGATS